MRIGVPKETKEGERRVGLLPAQVRTLVDDGHRVMVERGAGAGVGFDDDSYVAAGASVVETHGAWNADLVVKVKEVQDADLAHVNARATLFGFQHLVGEPERTRALCGRGASAIAYELLRDAEGRFPLLAPMSVIAGRMAIEVSARLLGRSPRQVLVLGAGNAGIEAARQAAARESHVVLLTRSARSRAAARAQLPRLVECGFATREAIERAALEADLVVGAVFIAAAPTPKLLPCSLVRRMRAGSVIVDVSIDGGGVAETSRPTSHAEPTYVAEGVVHYCVPNMPAADPVASAAALAEAALPHVRKLAGRGIERALREEAALRAALVVWKGHVTHPGIAQEAGLAYTLAFADVP